MSILAVLSQSLLLCWLGERHIQQVIVFITLRGRFGIQNRQKCEADFRMFCAESSSQCGCLWMQMVWSVAKVQAAAAHGYPPSPRCRKVLCWIFLWYQHREIRSCKFSDGKQSVSKSVESKFFPLNVCYSFLHFWIFCECVFLLKDMSCVALSVDRSFTVSRLKLTTNECNVLRKATIKPIKIFGVCTLYITVKGAGIA